MVRGNWQKRVETAQARRKETRQRKLRRESRGAYKALVQNQLWDYLDQYNDEILGRYESPSSSTIPSKPSDGVFIHIWTDHEPELIHYEDDGDPKGIGSSETSRMSNVAKKPTNVPVQGRRHSFDETLPNTQTRHKAHIVEEPTKGHLESASIQHQKLHSDGKKKGRRNSFDDMYHQPHDTNPSTQTSTLPIHPASSISSSWSEVIDSGDSENPRLCRKFFFLDNCPYSASTPKSGSSKKGSSCTCLYEHYPKTSMQKSLAQVLLPQYKCTQEEDSTSTRMVKETLESSSKACAMALAELDDLVYDTNYDTGDGSVDMLYYLSVPIHGIKHGTGPSQSDVLSTNSPKVSKALLQYLNQCKCPMGSLVYMTIGTNLVFDRYKGGLISSGYTSSSMIRSNKESVGSVPSLISRLPDSLLEYILLFLPNDASGILPMVCKLWYNEIGTNSPALWKSLIARNQWPSFSEQEEKKRMEQGLGSLQIYRSLFIAHYSIVKNMTNLFVEMKKMAAPSSHSIQKNYPTNCLTLSYSDSLSECVDILPLSDSSLLVAYQNCSVRLFDIVHSPSGHMIKQSLIVRIAPFGISKKTSTILRAVGMDHHVVLCSYSVHNSKRIKDPSSKCWLATVHLEDLLCMSNGISHDEVNEVVHVYNIWQRVLDFLPKIIDHAPDLFADFLIEGGSMNNLYIKIGKELVSCNGGRFMFLAHILTGPDYDEDTIQLAVVSILFSTSGSSIVWMEFLPHTMQPELSDFVNLHTMRGVLNSKSVTTVIAVSSHGSHILLIEVDSKNNVVFREVHDDTQHHRAPDRLPRCVLMLPHEIVLAHKCPLFENAWRLSFLSYSEQTETSLSTLLLHDCCLIRRLQQVGDHVIAEVNFDSWSHYPRGSFGFIIIHTISRCEVHRYFLEEQDPVECSTRYRSLFTKNLRAFIVAEATNGGIPDSQDRPQDSYTIIVSGSFIKNVDKPPPEVESDATKRKQKKSSTKIGKKDGYARGMTQRG